ncbi:two-component system OmpR family response regulator [Friedmanniella endophytica]|uniref:Two-component system OmpR family response regulator n=1 Tax=Microlunatus kandeliicorticis TaxID=1759536 RepID=A0A7W3IPP7_9ACTN|nr:response regulator transcription factor [Microlunatus kandeliicorticis]MBA8792949.1 two-component system OmpR family response regulator [Microlunatus kandeliicorticis]
MRTLLVEDERVLGTSLSEGLTGLGFVVDWVRDGGTGLLAATGNRYDVIVLDIMLPRLNGYKIVETLRQRGDTTPVLMLSAKDGEYDQTDAFELGADDYLVKPIKLTVLAAHLRALVRRGAPPREPELTVGTLRLDPRSKQVRRGDQEIVLTPREFELLQFLMHNSGQVLSKAAILTAVWDSVFELSNNVVEVYVGYLRNKIDVPFGVRTVQNVRGMGYRIVSDR